MPRPVTHEIGGLGTDPDIFYGWLDYLENPDPIIRYESNGQGIALYDEVDRDDRAGAVLEARYDAVAGEDFEMQPASTSQRDKLIAQFVEDNFRAINLPAATKDILQSILYGYYGLEIMWSQDPTGQVKVALLKGRHPRRLLFDQEGNIRIRTKKDQLKGELVPDEKFIVLTYGSTENPYGKGLGRRLWWCVWFKKNGIKFWAVFLEKFGQPTVVGKYPQGANSDQQAEVKRATELVQAKTGVIIPEGFALDLLEASRAGNASYEQMVQRMDTAITITVRKQNLTTEVTGGSRAASETHDTVEHRTTKMDASEVADLYNATLVKWLVDYNFAGVKEYPKLRFITEKEEVKKEEAETDAILITQMGLNVSAAFIAEKYNVKTDGPPRFLTQSTVPSALTVGAENPAFAERPESTATSNAARIDALADKAIAGAAPDFEANARQILDVVQSSSSEEEMVTRLADLYPKLDLKQMETILQQAMLAAFAEGIRTVQDDS